VTFSGVTDFNTVRSVLNSLPMRVYVLNHERKIQWVNRSADHGPGQPDRSEVKGKYCYREILGRGKPCEDCVVLKTLESKKTEYGELRTTLRGETRYYSVTATPLAREEGNEQPFIIETVQDITDQKRVEEELRRVNEFNMAIIDNAPVSIFTIDRNGMFTSVNPALATLSGLGEKAQEKLMGFNWLKNAFTVSCGLADYIAKGLKGQPFHLWDFPFTTYRGDKSQYIHFIGVPLKRKDGRVEGLLCIIEETTERVKISAQLRQEAKMSAIGRLATGIAHELNNPLATLVAHSELAHELIETFDAAEVRAEQFEELRGYLEVIQEHTFRCKNIMKDLLSLPLREGFEMKQIDVNRLLEGILEMINFRNKRIKLTKMLSARLSFIDGDLGALRQVFQNIVNNAIDAVEARGQAEIWVKTAMRHGKVEVEIEDTGVGIPDKIADLIFEPFFTTKESNKGLGLGLTLCYDFLSKMGGNIEMEQRLGGGTIFRITLPSSDGQKSGRRRS
jgi:PAS domain S-box-containing protein